MLVEQSCSVPWSSVSYHSVVIVLSVGEVHPTVHVQQHLLVPELRRSSGIWQ